MDALASTSMSNATQGMADIASMQASNGAMMGATKLASGVNVDKASQDFEAMFMTQMLSPMFDGLTTNPMFGGGHGEEVMKTFMLQEYGKIIAKNGHLGLTSEIKAAMIRLQDQADGKTDKLGRATNSRKGGYKNAASY